MSAPLTLQLDPLQVKAILKQALSTNPDLVREVIDELKTENSADKKFDQVVDQLFEQYDDVFRALA